jgi:hypothetical protein
MMAFDYPEQPYDVVYVTKYYFRYLQPIRRSASEYAEAAEIQRQIRAQNAEISKRPKHASRSEKAYRNAPVPMLNKEKRVRFKIPEIQIPVSPKDEVWPETQGSVSEYCRFCGRG